MDNSIDKKSLWEAGSRNGLILGLVTAAFVVLAQICTSALSGFAASMVSLLLWCAKFAGCIYLMYWFMKRYASANPSAVRQDVMKFGISIALCSALVYAAIYLVYVLYIAPETFQNAIDVAMQTYSGMLDSNSEAALETMMGKMPAITFFSNLIYCSIFGIVLSAIFSNNLRSNNPFDGNNANVQ